MKMKKIVSAFAALAMAASSFAAFTISASAATNIYSETFESGSSEGWSSITAGILSVVSTSTGNDTNVLRVDGPTGGTRTANYELSENLTSGIYRITLDTRLNSGSNTGSTYGVAITGAKMGSNWFADSDYTNSVFYLTGTTVNSGNSNSTYSVNGKSVDLTAPTSEGGFRATTGWITISVVADMDAKTADYTITKKNGDNAGKVLDSGTREFTTSALHGIGTVSARGYAENVFDNITIEKLTPPSFTLDSDTVEITNTAEPATVNVSDLVGTITAATSNAPAVATATFTQDAITITGVADGAATVTVTAENDGVSTSQDISVTVGEPETTTVTLKYAGPNGEKLADNTTIEDVYIGSSLDLSTYAEKITSYTDTSNGVVYTTTYTGDSSVNVTENLEYTLTYSFTENTYTATVNTVYHAKVDIAGTSTTGTGVEKTVYSNYADAKGTATFDDIPDGTYNITVTKGGYTFAADQTVTVSNNGANSATVGGTLDEQYLFYEDFLNVASGYNVFGFLRLLSTGTVQSINAGTVTVPFVRTSPSGTTVKISSLHSRLTATTRTPQIKFNDKNGAELISLTLYNSDALRISNGSESVDLMTYVDAEVNVTEDFVITFKNGKATGTYNNVAFELDVDSVEVGQIVIVGTSSNGICFEFKTIEATAIEAPEVDLTKVQAEFRKDSDTEASMRFLASPTYDEGTVSSYGFWFVNIDNMTATGKVAEGSEDFSSGDTFHYTFDKTIDITGATAETTVNFYAVPWVVIDGATVSGTPFTYDGTVGETTGNVQIGTKTYK